MTDFTQHPEAVLDYVADFTAHCVRYRDSNRDYANGTAVQPRKPSGFQYRSSAGRTGSSEPLWPTVLGRTVQDGSVTWTAEAISADSLTRTVSSVAWTADAGVTVTPITLTGNLASVLISGGEDGQDYAVECVATCSDPTKPVVPLNIQVRA